MGSNMKVLAIAASASLFCATAAFAADQTDETIPGLTEERESSSKFAGIPGAEFSGSIAGSYTYSPTNNESDAIQLNGGTYPGAHQGQLDEIFFAVDGLGDGSGKGGYYFEIAYGAIGNFGTGGLGGGQDLFIPNAYVQWNTELVTIDMGKFGTPVGYEVAGTAGHPNITLGQLWTQQSVDLAGARLSRGLGDSLSAMVAVVNGTAVDINETGDAPAIAWSLAADVGDNAFISFNGTWEDDPSAPGGPIDLTVLDVVATLEATDDLGLWLNFDYFLDGTAADNDGFGISAGASLALSDDLTTIIRGEFLDRDAAVESYGVTGTVSYDVTDNLNVAGEVRWDGTDGEAVINPSGGGFDENQVYGIIRTTFTF